MTLIVYKFDLGSKKLSRETEPTTVNASFSDLGTDTLYVLGGTAISGLHGGAGRNGKWRSGEIKMPSGAVVGYAWGRLNGEFSTAATLRIYADGALFYTKSGIVSNEPFRLPAGRRRAWSLELESGGRITSMVVASTTEELV